MGSYIQVAEQVDLSTSEVPSHLSNVAVTLVKLSEGLKTGLPGDIEVAFVQGNSPICAAHIDCCENLQQRSLK